MTNGNKIETHAFQPRIERPVSQPYQSPPSNGICFDFHRGRCYFRNCKFIHICLDCKGELAEKQCPRNATFHNIPENKNTSAQQSHNKMSAESQRPFRGPCKRR